MKLENHVDGDPTAPGSDRFGVIQIRVDDEEKLAGYVSGYTPDGTAITVRAEDLLRLVPDPDLGPAGARIHRLTRQAEMLADLLDRGFEVDGSAVLCERLTWAIYGRTTYDGELILAEFAERQDAVDVIDLVAQLCASRSDPRDR
jgi:hypothetical protein